MAEIAQFALDRRLEGGRCVNGPGLLDQSLTPLTGFPSSRYLHLRALKAARTRRRSGPLSSSSASSTGTKPNSAISAGLHLDVTQALGIEHAAVEQESHAARSSLPWPEEVDAREPPGVDLDPALLTGFAPAGLPRRLSVRLPPARRGSSSPPCRSVSR